MSLGIRCSAAASRVSIAGHLNGRSLAFASRHQLFARPQTRIFSLATSVQWSSQRSTVARTNLPQVSHRTSCSTNSISGTNSLTTLRSFHITPLRPSQNKPPIPAPQSPISPKPTTQHENIYNIPNLLTLTRLIAAPAVGYLIVTDDLRLALSLFIYAGVTDLLDGWMARRYKLQTVVGSVIDPMADKLLMTIMTVCLAVKGLLPAYLATLILGRDAALAIAAIYYRYASLPLPKTMGRYWDFSLPSAEVHPTTVSKINTFLQLVLIGSVLAVPVVGPSASTLDLGMGIEYFGYLVAGTTVWSGLSYAVLKDAVRILGSDETVKIRQGRTGRRIIGVLFGSIVLVAVWLKITEEEKGRGEEKQKELKRV